MKELACYRMKDGNMLVLADKGNGVFEVAIYDKSDIEQWHIECGELEAWQTYVEKKYGEQESGRKKKKEVPVRAAKVTE
jgi:hypothetical protein